MTTVWFYRENLLPLAEHAMACPRQRLTDAQTLAHAPSSPALVWTGTPTSDRLTSNGVPIWYGRSGVAHYAEGRHWVHTATGRRGTAHHDDYTTAYLPLEAGTPDEPLISVLRQARARDHHWVAITIVRTDTHLIPPARIRTVGHRDQLVPDTGAWTPATVACRSLAGVGYPALIADGHTTHQGHEIARFDRPTVEQMISDLHALLATPTALGRYPLLRLHNDVVTVDQGHLAGNTCIYREVERVAPDADGRYAIGAYRWTWMRADGQPAPAAGTPWEQ